MKLSTLIFESSKSIELNLKKSKKWFCERWNHCQYFTKLIKKKPWLVNVSSVHFSSLKCCQFSAQVEKWSFFVGKFLVNFLSRDLSKALRVESDKITHLSLCVQNNAAKCKYPCSLSPIKTRLFTKIYKATYAKSYLWSGSRETQEL